MRNLSTQIFVVTLALTPVSVACKFLLGATDALWIDPSLLLSLLVLLLLLPRWQDFLHDSLRPLVAGAALLVLASLGCALSGAILRPPASLYTVLREPLRLWLNLAWFITAAWFCRFRPRAVLVGSILAVIFALGAGIYLELAAFHFAPAPALVAAYTRSYMARQTIWFQGFPVPRMGSLFFEAPPFGLFMFSMLVVLRRMRAFSPAFLPGLTGAASFLAGLGVLLSLSDQVLMAGAIGVFSGLPGKTGVPKRPAMMWGLALLVTVLICAFEFQSLVGKQASSDTGVVSRINGSSVGERNFHLRYGLHLLGAYPAATLLGVGPGRYGEYAADIGTFPNTVNMQTSEMEILVEWGLGGVVVWMFLLGALAGRIQSLHGIAGLGLLLALIIADSFQANWKYEGIFLAIAALAVAPRYVHE
jgi:hypothetical protein